MRGRRGGSCLKNGLIKGERGGKGNKMIMRECIVGIYGKYILKRKGRSCWGV